MKICKVLKAVSVILLSLAMLCTSFTTFAAEQTAQELINSWMQPGENSHNSYPEDVGGVFAIVSYNAAEKKETYTYYISLVGRTAEREAEIKVSVTDPENIKFTDAKYRYAQLEAVQKEIENAGMAVDGINIISVGIMEESNYVRVGTAEDADALEKALAAKYGDMAKASAEDPYVTLDTAPAISEAGTVPMPSPMPAAPQSGKKAEESNSTAYAVIFISVSVICFSAVSFSRRRAKRLADGGEVTAQPTAVSATEQKNRDSAEESGEEVLENLPK